MRYTNKQEVFSLDQDGFTVIHNVLDSSECRQLQNMMWKWLNDLTIRLPIPIRENEPDTYKTFSNCLFPKRNMLLQNGHVGHNPMSWKLRIHSKIQEIFSEIWDNDSDLITSFDGLSIYLPPQKKKLINRPDSYYNFHCDQNFNNRQRCCVQGLVNIFDVRPGDATLRVLQNSHQQQFHPSRKVTGDWYQLNTEETEWFRDRGCEDLCLAADAGSMFLWDSRTVHQGMPSIVANPNIRCVCYVCMLPRKKASSSQLNKRLKAFESRRTSNHLPHCIKLFPNTPRTYGAPIPDLNIVDFTQYGIPINSDLLKLI